MDFLFSHYNTLLWIMTACAIIVFLALLFVDAGYGIFRSKKWGPSLPNKLGWVLMESPVFILMSVFFFLSDRWQTSVFIAFFIIFQLHYFHRSFIFPFLMRGKSKMPISIVLMGACFNTINAFIQGAWLFYIAPDNYYTIHWLTSPFFILGCVIFGIGMFINIQSDNVIRQLRKAGDSRYYMPKEKFFKHVSSANYFGECLEWLGFACLTWSFAGLVFFLWTFANLAPRAIRINKKYQEDFPEEFHEVQPKAIIPKIL